MLRPPVSTVKGSPGAIATMEKRKKDTSSSKIPDAAKRPMMYRITTYPLPIAEPWWWGLH